MFMKVEREIGGKTLSIETGNLARQADAAVLVRLEDTVVLVSVVSGQPRDGIEFFPLTVEYREMTYAAGKIPGGFFKREGRPSAKEIITMRLIDRPVRPLFPKYYRNEVQVVAIVLSADQENDPDILALLGASTALSISKIPFQGPIGAVRVGIVGEEVIINPTHSQVDEGNLELVVAGNRDGILMVEGGANELSEDMILNAIGSGYNAIKGIVDMQLELLQQIPVVKDEVPDEPLVSPELQASIEEEYYCEYLEQIQKRTKKNKAKEIRELKERILVARAGDRKGEDREVFEKSVDYILEEMQRKAIRELAKAGKRIDGRALSEIRPIECQVGTLPRTHGSALFTRGETQAMVVATLGTSYDEQVVDGLLEEYTKKFMLHYNFPPFCVGEIWPIRGPGRREIGHGYLAERSLQSVLPDAEEFPYTIRIVSDILESNGSSSMATVCGGTLCLMDAGVPIRQPVAGIAMGLIKEGDDYWILADIIGNEDHHGDMDFKVAGTQRGITGLQMDIKVPGITERILRDALTQAREGRIFILREMLKVLDRPRKEISRHAPKLIQLRINPEKIGALIGPGGKNIKRIQEETKSEISVENDGRVTIASPNLEMAEVARKQVEALTAEVEVGKVYEGRVTAVKEFGAFVEILPGQEGLIHVTELSHEYVGKVRDILSVNDKIEVKVISIDEQGRIKLSRKALLEKPVAQSNGHRSHFIRRSRNKRGQRPFSDRR